MAYPNRTDLMQGPRAAGGGGAPQGPPQPAGQSFVTPDMVPNLTDPSADDRPITDGLPSGPGAGPEALGTLPGGEPDLTMPILQALYRQTGSPYLLRLMSRKRGVDLATRLAP